MVDDGEGFVLARPSTVAQGEGLYLTDKEVRYLVAYLLDELDQPDASRIDEVAHKLNDYLLSVKSVGEK